MAIDGELNGTIGVTHMCGMPWDEPRQVHLELQVCQSGAGYYLGYWCAFCGPYSRESGYYRTSEDAHAALDSMNASWRDTDYHG